MLWVLLFLVVGYAKFDGWVKSYLHYLNDKDWDQAVAQVNIWDLSSYGHLFWTEVSDDMITWTGSVLPSEEVEELHVDLDDASETSGDTWNDIFDPAFADDFESFFAEDEDSNTTDNTTKNTNVTDSTDEDTFGFVNNETWVNLSWDTEAENAEAWLSDNKKKLLHLFRR